MRNGWGTQGGSTITQQVARQSFLTREKTLRRKLKEIVVAPRLESEFSKRQILEWYLNKVYFGDGLYGVEAASLGYFGKHAARARCGRGRAAGWPRQGAVELRPDGEHGPRARAPPG